MRKAVIYLLLISASAFIYSGVNAFPAGRAHVIRILSYNIHHGAGTDDKLDLERIAAVIRSANPDVVSLQEVDHKTERTGRVDQAKELARLTGMHFVFGSSMDFEGGQYGNAVLTNFSVRESKVTPLPGEPRSALLVVLSIPDDEFDGAFAFVAAHLDTEKEPRLKSVPLIEEAFNSSPKLPTILAGDLNAEPGRPTMQEFARTWQNATDREGFHTYPADHPSKQIDYILYRPSKRWKVEEITVLDETVASDHRPILAVLKFISGQDKE